MEDGFRQRTAALVEALARGDAAAAAALYADDGKLLTATSELIAGRIQIEAYWRAGLALGLAGFALEPSELEVGDGTAVEIGRYALTLAGDGVPADSGTYLALHRRQADGSWRRAVDVFNPDVPARARSDRHEEGQ